MNLQKHGLNKKNNALPVLLIKLTNSKMGLYKYLNIYINLLNSFTPEEFWVEFISQIYLKCTKQCYTYRKP